MRERFREYIENNIKQREVIVLMVFFVVAGLLMWRLFTLQIVHGEEYQDDFALSIRKERTISSSRGNIYDVNGTLLAYNELTYSVTAEDVFDSAGKNDKMNAALLNTLHILERNGDSCSADFGIYIDENGEYQFASTDARRLRFLADIYGYTSTEKLTEKEKVSTARDIIDKMATDYGIGARTDPNDRSTFVPGMGYEPEEVLKLVTIRYAMRANSFQKYIPTTIATNVSEQTVAAIKENNDILPGISIAEDYIRKYVDGEYFSHIIGYTGKISTDELTDFNVDLEERGMEPSYEMNDTVGKAGIEKVMDSYLQGHKGKEIIYVDNMGKEISAEGVVNSGAGSDVYLTIDAELQKAVYDILEQSIAGILLDKIIDVKTFDKSAVTSSNIQIPIDDVYFALFDNSVINLEHLAGNGAGENERAVHDAFLEKQSAVLNWIRQELLNGETPYRELSDEYQIYESYIVSTLLINDTGILTVDSEDAMYRTWSQEETISIREFLEYAVSVNWIDVSMLKLESSYADSDTIYQALVDFILEKIDRSSFNKKLYRYMLRSDMINGRQVCMVLAEQNIIHKTSAELRVLRLGAIDPYHFMKNLIRNLEITPAQLALDPYSGSCVIVDPNSGQVRALVSYPSYDNNRLANGIDAEYYAALQNDLSKPLWDYATQMRTAPGSTYKMVSSATALMNNVVSLYDQIECTGAFTRFSDTQMKCWIYPGRHNELNVSEAITHSCNYFFYEVGYQLGATGNEEAPFDNVVATEKMKEYADLFGLTEKSGVEIDESMPVFSENANSSQSAIGQGEHSYTTVGLARYVAAVANSGTCYNISLLDKVTDSAGNLLVDLNPEVRNTIDIPDSYWNAIHSGMKGVVEGKAYFKEAGLSAAGKTGTAQENKTRPNHALFVGYAPYDEPQLALATRVANGYTSDYAAQISCKVMQYYFGTDEERAQLKENASQMQTVTSAGD